LRPGVLMGTVERVSVRPFRFGMSVHTPGRARAAWQALARQIEDLGYDVLTVPDHLGMPAPFPGLLAAAEVTDLRLGTYVLNTGFYRPALLARDAAHVNLFTDGRLELGLGAGFAREEFDAAGLTFRPGGERIDFLAETITALRAAIPGYGATNPPLLLAGNGDRMLRLAAREADMVGFSAGSSARQGVDPRAELAERVRFLRAEAGARFTEIELNLTILVFSITGGAAPDLAGLRQFAPGLTDEQLLALPNVLTGSAHRIVEQLHDLRENFGISYFTVVEQHITEFATIIDMLR
jgi:probable F420-dependent oxidoreductase